MRISVNWLKDFIDVDQSPEEIINTLNSIGLMVDSWEEQGGDLLLELETYANRPDTLGHMGVARELAAALNLPFKEQSWPLTELEEASADNIDIEIYDEDLCPRYAGIVVKDIKVGPSPGWLQKRLATMGLTPINNVVDASNYILFATSQPTHAFDLAKLSGQKIIVRKAKKGEAFRSLEGEDIDLSPEMLVIADEEKPVALAGVIGGENTAVSDNTRDILIESAYFDPVSIRKTSKATAIQTDASYRFERGADVAIPPKAAVMVASLLTQFGGKAAEGIVDVYPKPRKSRTVVLRHKRLCDFLGVKVSADFVARILAKLEFQVEPQPKKVWQVRVPFFRVDIEREADLIEEIARFFGYDNIPSRIPPLIEYEPPPDPQKKQIQKLRQILFFYGFDEVVNFSFSSPEEEELLQSGQQAMEIRNPISTKASHLRTSMLGGLLENIVWNTNRGVEGIHIFEIGNVYFQNDTASREQLTLALATTGLLEKDSWHEQRRPTNFFHLKGACESLLTQLRFAPVSFQAEDYPQYEKMSSLTVLVKGEKIGKMGKIQSEILAAYSRKEPVWSAELDLQSLFLKQPQPFRYSPVIKYPSVIRDISFMADQDVSYQDVKLAVEGMSIPYLEKFELYDRFSGSSVAKGKVSLSFRFYFRHPQRTLLAEEVENYQEKIIKTLSSEFNFHLREGGKIDK
jgi:phenylalanyl-tRNA synthetase beta chain